MFALHNSCSPEVKICTFSSKLVEFLGSCHHTNRALPFCLGILALDLFSNTFPKQHWLAVLFDIWMVITEVWQMLGIGPIQQHCGCCYGMASSIRRFQGFHLGFCITHYIHYACYFDHLMICWGHSLWKNRAWQLGMRFGSILQDSLFSVRKLIIWIEENHENLLSVKSFPCTVWYVMHNDLFCFSCLSL